MLTVLLSALAAAAPLTSGGLVIGNGSPPGLGIEWSQVIASPADDWINDIVPVGSEEYLLAGFVGRTQGEAANWRGLYARLSGDGKLIARHEYGAEKGIDAFWTGKPASSGDVWLGGFTSRIGAGGIDAWAARVDAQGRLLDDKAFGEGGYDRFTGMAAVDDGYVFVGHSEPVGVERRRLFAVKLGRSGQTLWERTIDADPDALAALYVEPAGDGGYIVSGGLGHGDDSNIFILKLDATGRELWRRTVGTPEAADVNHGLAVGRDGTVTVVGYVKSWASRDNDILAATFSREGTLLKKSLVGGAGDDRPILLKAGPEGDLWVVGYTRSASSGGDWDMVVARLDGAGEFMPGVATLGTVADDNGTAIRPLASGGALVAGYSKGLGSPSEDAIIFRLSSADWTEPNPSFQTRVVP